MRWTKAGALGLACSLLGLGLLLFTFSLAYALFRAYQLLQPSSDLGPSMGTLLHAAVQALFLGILGWTGSLLMLRGVDYLKVDREAGIMAAGKQEGKSS
ncbi:MAG: hypothetical protein C4339_04665 [Nitrososphaerota archaeon]